MFTRRCGIDAQPYLNHQLTVKRPHNQSDIQGIHEARYYSLITMGYRTLSTGWVNRSKIFKICPERLLHLIHEGLAELSRGNVCSGRRLAWQMWYLPAEKSPTIRNVCLQRARYAERKTVANRSGQDWDWTSVGVKPDWDL